LPPIVPRFLTAGSPTIDAASASAIAERCTSLEAASSACVVSAPIRRPSDVTAIPLSSGTRPMSMTAAGAARRSFISGMRL
jgi:hypothetical protein